MSFQPLPSSDAWIPSFQLYDSTGTNLIWTFYAVDDTNLPQQPVATVVLSNFRSSGAVVINGGMKSFVGFVHFIVQGSGYQDVMGQIDALVAAIPVNTPFKLKIGITPSSSITYNVKRVEDFVWLNVNRDYRNYSQEIRLNLLCNAW